ncbi:DUF3363 domain-containing protein [Paraburkholderia sp. CNPSo 3157]|uniref:DUF3363 domain-containing protein n=1 Tax=Paraburkholderia franconis TaxID=2654983 RepID=A0A7X1NKR9_9BURK|nr:DUF3363 domain-containing protein [Paraburkholderia franconis]
MAGVSALRKDNLGVDRFVAKKVRRAGIVEREVEGVWRMPDDLPERGRQHDAQQLSGGVAVELIAPAHR